MGTTNELYWESVNVRDRSKNVLAEVVLPGGTFFGVFYCRETAAHLPEKPDYEIVDMQCYAEFDMAIGMFTILTKFGYPRLLRELDRIRQQSAAVVIR